jgi:RNA polymerase sporulation-specific sigma factor
VTFGLFARICVHHRIVDLVRRESAKGVVDCDVDGVSDSGSIERGIVERETFEQLMKSAKGMLSDYEYRVLVLHIQGYKTSSIAKMLDRAPKSVDNAKYRIFSRLRLLFGDITEF